MIVIGEPPAHLIEVAKEKGIDLVFMEAENERIKEEISREFRPEPMIITAPPIMERSFEDYKSGQERRRERRAKKRRGF